jgi:hypothetical protein
MEKGVGVGPKGSKRIYSHCPGQNRVIRTNTMYNYQVEKSATEPDYKGIKGR